MSVEEDVKNLTLQIKNLENKSSELSNEAYDLREKRDHLLSKMILDEKLLAKSDWEIKVNHSSIRLDYIGIGLTALVEKVRKSSQGDFASWLELSDGINLQFGDDNSISLRFDEAKQIMPFVKKHDLHITGIGIISRLAEIKRETAALEEICHQFNL